MNRIQLLILNQQIFSYLMDNSNTFTSKFSEQKRLVEFTCKEISNIDNVLDEKLDTVEKKFESFEEIDKSFYEYIDVENENIINAFTSTLLSQSSYKRLPKLLTSAYILFVTLSHFEPSKKKLYMNEILEISKMYLETKFIKMLNSIMDNYEA